VLTPTTLRVELPDVPLCQRCRPCKLALMPSSAEILSSGRCAFDQPTEATIAGKLGDLFGRKPFLIAGMVGFVAASALAGLSQDMNQLIIFRIIQGLFGGLLFASAFTVLADIFPPAQRARMQGLFGGVFGLSSILGPVIGGFLTDNLGWRWVFYVNLPVGILGVLMVVGFLPFVRTTASWRDIDFWGSGALAAGLIPLLVALSLAGQQGWGSSEVLGLMAEGRSNAGIARQLWVTEGTVEKHVRSILAKLRLPETADDHRRVLAVVTFLDAR
jgi:MFS family permease